MSMMATQQRTPVRPPLVEGVERTEEASTPAPAAAPVATDSVKAGPDYGWAERWDRPEELRHISPIWPIVWMVIPLLACILWGALTTP